MTDRRSILKWAMLGGGAALARLFAGPLANAATPQKEQAAQGTFERATRGMPVPRIKDVSVIQVGGGGVNDSTVVKVLTDQAGLYGYGCSMTNLTLDLTSENFGIHEHIDYTPPVKDIFRGHLEIKDGYAWISDEPGWGIEIDEALAAQHPITDEHPNEFRTPDGSVIQGTG